MTNVEAIFDKYDEEFLKFDRIEKQRSKRPDLHAFILLDETCPSNRDIVAAAEHDEIYLGVSPEELEAATEEQILELIRCGVRLDRSTDPLAMFT